MVVSQFDGNQRTPAQPARKPGAQASRHSAHGVQFYGDDTVLLSGLGRVMGATLGSGGAVLLVATPAHVEQLEALLQQVGLDLCHPAFAGRYLAVDAIGLASELIHDGMLDSAAASTALQGYLDRIKPADGASPLIFGELVAVLWDQGWHEAALQVEHIWAELAETNAFTLHCAYPLDSFDPVKDAAYIQKIRDVHTEEITDMASAAMSLHILRSRDSELFQIQEHSSAATEQQRQTESTLAMQRAEISELLEQTLDGIQQVTPDHTIRWANRAVLEMLDYPASAYLGHSFRDFFVDGAEFDAWFTRLQQGETIVDQPGTLRASDGSERFVRLYATRGRGNNERESYRVYTRDVTGRIHMEQVLRDRNRELRKAIAARDEFLSVAAHELKTPATTLRAYTQLLLRDLRRQRDIPVARLETSLSAIEAQSKKLDHLVSRLLDSGQIEEGRLRIVPVVTDVAVLIRGVVEAQHINVRQTIEIDAPAKMPVLVDPVRFEQVVTNLLNNAVKFSPDGGRIVLELRSDATGALRFVVTDEGIGIPDKELAAIFSRFYQGSGPSHLSGLGLGLYITREIVKLHGGDIAVESPDHPGARFVVTLPASLLLPVEDTDATQDS